jgi:hypothetical protein
MQSLLKQAMRARAVMIAALLSISSFALAHEEFRVIGTLASASDSHIQVRDRDGKTLSIKIDKQTVIRKDGANVEADTLTTGNSVVVDALGDSEADLLAIEIRIVPPIAGR